MINKNKNLRNKDEKGIVLFIVIVFVMLSMLLALWASRSSIFNEMVVGNDADYQRTFEAAQTMLQEAELDIRGETASGTWCGGEKNKCRNAKNALLFPTDENFDQLIEKIQDDKKTQCSDGICLLGFDWKNGNLKDLMKPNIGAQYGSFTNAQQDTSMNPLLSNAWYWVEPLKYLENANNLLTNVDSNNFQPIEFGNYPAYAYRITAYAEGSKKNNTEVVLQQIYVRQSVKD